MLSGYEPDIERSSSLRVVSAGGGVRPAVGAVCSFCGADLWDSTYSVVGAGGPMCDSCVEDAHAAVESARIRGAEPGVIRLQPRVTGDIPSEGAVDAIVEAIRTVFDGIAEHDRWRAHLEDADALAAADAEALQRFPGPRNASVSRIRFLRDDAADVRFSVIVPHEGRVVRDGDQWKVSRDTYSRGNRASRGPVSAV